MDAEMLTFSSLLQQQISNLDGTIRTWSEALSAFTEEAGRVPVGMLCIVDGLHWLDDWDTEKLLRGLL